MNDDQKRPFWHWDGAVSPAIILAIIIQTVAIVWGASNLATRVEVLEARVEAASNTQDRLARVEEKMISLTDDVREIKRAVVSPERGR